MYCLLSKVFDYDWGQKDDFLGASLLDLTSLQLSRLQIKLAKISGFYYYNNKIIIGLL